MLARSPVRGPYHKLRDYRARWIRDYRPVSELKVPVHEVARPCFAAIDAHNHLGRWLTADQGWAIVDVPAVLELMEDIGVTGMVNLDGRWGDELEANLDRYDRAYPGRFSTFCHVDWNELGSPGGGERLASSLSRSVRAGARGLKVWKDLGLAVRDAKGSLVLPDDHRLSPLWATAASEGVPVLIHTGDPAAFFKPIDRFNERLEELLLVGRSLNQPGLPTLQRLHESLERVVADNPSTTFIAAHVACSSEDLTWVDHLLDTYPNLFVDTSASLAALGRQPRAARRLFTSRADRILWGTDNFPPHAPTFRLWYRFLETDDEYFPHSAYGSYAHGRWHVSGLDLPEDVLESVYRGNALRLIPGFAPTPEPSTRR